MMHLFVLVSCPFGRVSLASHVYKRPVMHPRTPSEFSSVPILVADELASFLCLCTTILGEYPITE